MPRLTISTLLVSAMLLLSGCATLMDEFATAMSSGGGGGSGWSTTPRTAAPYVPPRCYQTSRTRQTCFQ